MIINKISDKNNVKIITEQYLKFLDAGALPSEILVISFNTNSKKNIEKNILKSVKNNLLTDFKIHTFNGLIYNTILNNWCELENLLDKEKCINCGKCQRNCPMNVDMTDNKRTRKNGTECILCMKCIEECPRKALHL